MYLKMHTICFYLCTFNLVVYCAQVPLRVPRILQIHLILIIFIKGQNLRSKAMFFSLINYLHTLLRYSKDRTETIVGVVAAFASDEIEHPSLQTVIPKTSASEERIARGREVRVVIIPRSCTISFC